ncbi:twin-arginine translocation signal domain-containing protein [Verrucomicrobium spinosum]|uniref:twin-arginine translocation signal domain-containing protein n=1 Tax=Verrucomicrobium spinosum TaxID=2736 RepID=UPI0012E114E4
MTMKQPSIQSLDRRHFVKGVAAAAATAFGFQFIVTGMGQASEAHVGGHRHRWQRGGGPSGSDERGI